MVFFTNVYKQTLSQFYISDTKYVIQMSTFYFWTKIILQIDKLNKLTTSLLEFYADPFHHAVT